MSNIKSFGENFYGLATMIYVLKCALAYEMQIWTAEFISAVANYLWLFSYLIFIIIRVPIGFDPF